MKSRLYYLFLLTTVLRVIGDAVEGVALPWHLLNETSSLLSVAGYSLASMIPWVITPPLMGRFLDRTTHKVKLAFIALFLQAFLALALIRFSSNVWAFYSLIAGISALDILHRYFGFTLIASMTLKGKELQRLNAQVESVSGATSLLSFPIVGFLAYRFGVKLMLLDALFLLTAALALLPYLGVEVTRKESPQKEATSIIMSRKLIIGFIATLLLFNFAIASSRIFIFSSLKDTNFGELIYGNLQSVRSIGGLLAAILLATFMTRKDLRKAIFVGMAFESLVVLLLGLPSVYLLFTGMLLLGIGGQVLNISMNSLFQKAISMESLGTFKGAFDALATLIIPLSQLTFALLIEHGFSVSVLAFGAFVVGTVSGALMLRTLKDFSAFTI